MVGGPPETSGNLDSTATEDFGTLLLGHDEGLRGQRLVWECGCCPSASICRLHLLSPDCLT